jgi:uncharacterized protein YccT (UPF0319 family)
MHKGRDWFKPVVGTGNKEKALNIEGAVTRRIESFRNYYDGVGGMSAAEVIADVYDEVAPALAKQGWNDAQIYQTITRQFAEALSKQSDKTGMKSDELINKFNDTETQFSNLAKAIAQRRQADNRNAPDEAAVKDAQKNINGWYHAAVIDILVTAKDGKDANDKIDVLSQEYLLKNIEIFDGANDINDESGGSVKALTGFYAKASAMEKETGIDPRSIAAKSGAADATQKMRDSKAAAMFERKFGEGSVRDIRSLNGMQIVTTMEGKQYELRPNKTGNDLEIYEVRVSSHPDGRRIENDAQVRDSYGRIITLGNRR